MLQVARKVDLLLREAVKLEQGGKFAEAIELLDSALALDRSNDALNGRILYQRAGVHLVWGRTETAEEDCARALRKLPNYVKARIRRARALLAMGRFVDAVEELQTAERSGKLSAQQKVEVVALLGRAKAAAEGSGSENSRPRAQSMRDTAAPATLTLYTVLGVSCNASGEEIRKAYKRAALKTHPDHNSAPSATEDFKKLAEAYAVLSSPKKRMAYDSTGKVPR